MLVKATDKYEKLNIKDLELNKIPKKGEIFEVSEKRYKILTKENEYHEIFVEKVEEVKEIETATKKVKKETAVKKNTKKTK
jgi:hypothetical protein